MERTLLFSVDGEVYLNSKPILVFRGGRYWFQRPQLSPLVASRVALNPVIQNWGLSRHPRLPWDGDKAAGRKVLCEDVLLRKWILRQTGLKSVLYGDLDFLEVNERNIPWLMSLDNHPPVNQISDIIRKYPNVVPVVLCSNSDISSAIEAFQAKVLGSFVGIESLSELNLLEFKIPIPMINELIILRESMYTRFYLIDDRDAAARSNNNNNNNTNDENRQSGREFLLQGIVQGLLEKNGPVVCGGRRAGLIEVLHLRKGLDGSSIGLSWGSSRDEQQSDQYICRSKWTHVTNGLCDIHDSESKGLLELRARSAHNYSPTGSMMIPDKKLSMVFPTVESPLIKKWIKCMKTAIDYIMDYYEGDGHNIFGDVNSLQLPAAAKERAREPEVKTFINFLNNAGEYKSQNEREQWSDVSRPFEFSILTFLHSDFISSSDDIYLNTNWRQVLRIFDSTDKERGIFLGERFVQLPHMDNDDTSVREDHVSPRIKDEKTTRCLERLLEVVGGDIVSCENEGAYLYSLETNCKNDRAIAAAAKIPRKRTSTMCLESYASGLYRCNETILLSEQSSIQALVSKLFMHDEGTINLKIKDVKARNLILNSLKVFAKVHSKSNCSESTSIDVVIRRPELIIHDIHRPLNDGVEKMLYNRNKSRFNSLMYQFQNVLLRLEQYVDSVSNKHSVIWPLVLHVVPTNTTINWSSFSFGKRDQKSPIPSNIALWTMRMITGGQILWYTALDGVTKGPSKALDEFNETGMMTYFKGLKDNIVSFSLDKSKVQKRLVNLFPNWLKVNNRGVAKEKESSGESCSSSSSYAFDVTIKESWLNPRALWIHEWEPGTDVKILYSLLVEKQ